MKRSKFLSVLMTLLISLSALALAIGAGGSGIILIYGATSMKLAPVSDDSGGGSTQVSSTSGSAVSAQSNAKVKAVGEPKDNFAPAGEVSFIPPSAAQLEEGKKLYSTSCLACHQPTGLGMPGVFPPLAGSDWVKEDKPDRAIAVVLHGLQGAIQVNGQPFNTPMAMPPQGMMMDDAKIAAVLTYVRNSWGNQTSAVTADQVHIVREQHKPQGMWTQEQIDTAFPHNSTAEASK